MSREEVYEKLNEVFRDVFDDESIVLNDNIRSDDIEDWDSLTNIGLLVSLESAFEIKFTLDEVQRMSNVGELADIIMGRCLR